MKYDYINIYHAVQIKKSLLTFGPTFIVYHSYLGK